MKLIVFYLQFSVLCFIYLQFIISLEGLGMFFSSAALIRRLRRYTATHIEDFVIKNLKKSAKK